MGANQKIHNVANGQQFLRRKMTLNHLTSLNAFAIRRVFEKVKVEAQQNTPEQYDPTEWSSLAMDTYEDDPNFEYKDLGFCAVLFADFTGGSMTFSGEYAVDNDLSKQAQIAPYNINDENMQDRIKNVPSWTIERGDYICVFIDEYPICYEVMDINNQSFVGSFSQKYVLARRDILALDQFVEEYVKREDA